MNSITGKVLSPKQYVDMAAVPTNSIKMITPKSVKQIKQIREGLASSTDKIKTDCLANIP